MSMASLNTLFFLSILVISGLAHAVDSNRTHGNDSSICVETFHNSTVKVLHSGDKETEHAEHYHCEKESVVDDGTKSNKTCSSETEPDGTKNRSSSTETHSDGAQKNRKSFVYTQSIRVFKTDAGELRVLPESLDDDENVLSRMRIGLGFLTLEPQGLFLPHYSDANSLFVVSTGRGQFSWVDHHGELRQMDIEQGDIYKIERGTVFQFFNKDKRQRLHIFSIHDLPVSSGCYDIFQSFFIAGGDNPHSILSGFGEDVVATVFNVSYRDAQDLVSSHAEGPIVYADHMNETSPEESSTSKNNRFEVEPVALISERLSNPLSKDITLALDILSSEVVSVETNANQNKKFNIHKKDPNFSNDYGLTIAVDENDFKPLKDMNKGVFLVKLKAGGILAPHWNPTAMEIALVTRGEGEIRIVYPNGTAVTEKVREHQLFYVPKNLPMCHIASKRGPFEFMGFVTSSRPNRPQFLAGLNSVLRKLNPNVLASTFNVSVENVETFLDSQRDAVILSSAAKL